LSRLKLNDSRKFFPLFDLEEMINFCDLDMDEFPCKKCPLYIGKDKYGIICVIIRIFKIGPSSNFFNLFDLEE